MDRIAFVFSGQGDQFPGMGRDLCEKYPAAAAVFDACERIRPGTRSMCFDGTEADLAETKNTQPCLFAMELAAAAVLTEHGIRPAAAAGFSLGEVAAATAAGLCDLDTGFSLVCHRGALMQAAAEKFDTSMAAVVKLPPETVEELARRYTQVYPVNYNCPGQISVSGLTEQMTAFAADVKAAGGRAIPLKVKGAFHSPFMNEAAAAFAEVLAGVQLHTPAVPLYSNVTAAPYGENAADLLSRQICSPVRWERIIREMIAAGVGTFIEIGPGRTLTGMIRKIDGNVKTYAVCDLADWISEVIPC